MIDKLNIAMFGQKRTPSREGGVEIVVGELSTRMVERGHRVTVYDRRSQWPCMDEYKGVRVRRVPTINVRGLAALTSSLFAAIRTALGKYDVVHIHSEGQAAMCFLLKLSGKRVVVTVHGLDWAREKWGCVAGAYIKLGEKAAVRWADEIIVLSKNTQAYFRNTYGRETVFIPNGIDRPQQREADEITKVWGRKRDDYVLFVGRLVPEKGLRTLIRAWQQVKTSKKLVIVGGASDTDSFVDELHAMAGENVQFAGFQQGSVLEEFYSNAYLYVLPSDLEGMPMSLLEAMSYGNCCLTSDIPECAEVIEDKGVVFPHGDMDGLRDALQYLLDDPEAVERYRRGAADFITAKYKWDDAVDRTLEVYMQ